MCGFWILFLRSCLRVCCHIDNQLLLCLHRIYRDMLLKAKCHVFLPYCVISFLKERQDDHSKCQGGSFSLPATNKSVCLPPACLSVFVSSGKVLEFDKFQHKSGDNVPLIYARFKHQSNCLRLQSESLPLSFQVLTSQRKTSCC